MSTICSSIRSRRCPEGSLERLPQSAPGSEGLARAQFVQPSAVVHTLHTHMLRSDLQLMNLIVHQTGGVKADTTTLPPEI